MHHHLKSALGTGTGFIRSLFFDRQERVFTSAHTPGELVEVLKQARVGWMNDSPGLVGRVRGNGVRLGWSPGRMRNRSPTLFYGQVEPAPEGSRLRGYFAPHWFFRCFMAVWLGFIALFSLVMVWTVLFPLAGLGMMWITAQLWGTAARHAEEGLTAELRRLCGMPTMIKA